MKLLVYIYSIGLLFSLFSFGNRQTNESIKEKNIYIDSTTKIKVSKKTFKQGDTIIVTVNGILGTNGNCGMEPQIGLLKRNNNDWDTLINILGLPVMACGLSSRFFDNQIAVIHVLHGKPIKKRKKNPPQYWDKYLKPGEYKFSFLGGMEGIIYSDSFIIE